MARIEQQHRFWAGVINPEENQKRFVYFPEVGLCGFVTKKDLPKNYQAKQKMNESLSPERKRESGSLHLTRSKKQNSTIEHAREGTGSNQKESLPK